MRKVGSEAKRGGATILSKQKIYAKISERSEEIISGLLKLATSKNESIKLGALKILLNKILPDLKAIDPQDEHEEELYEAPDLCDWLASKGNKELISRYNQLAEKYQKETGKEISKILEKAYV